jgi:hypothetical protein
MEEQEKSPSGAPIFRYEDYEPRPFQPAIGDGDNIEAISNHIEKHIGPIASVFHEILSDLVHIDVHWVKPSEKFPFHTFVTSGMSDLPMNVPEGLEEHQFAELCILLPENWDIKAKDMVTMSEIFQGENNYWPIRWLKILAKFPHELRSWVAWGHTIPNGETADPFAENTQLGCLLLMPSLSLPQDFFEMNENGKLTKFYCLYPLYREEMDFKLKKGMDALMEKFDKHKIKDVVDINRVNTCKKKGFLGLW